MNLNNGCIEEILDINGTLLLAHFEMNIFVFSLCIVMKKYLYFFSQNSICIQLSVISSIFCYLLPGFIPTSSGTAWVNGYDIREDIASVRSSLGLCPQHDVLFDSLTVEEHLSFFARVTLAV